MFEKTRFSQSLRRALPLLLMAALLAPVLAQESAPYPEVYGVEQMERGRAGSTWYLVVSVEQSQASTSTKGPVVDLLVEQILNYTTEYVKNGTSYSHSFLEKVASSQVPGGAISVGDRLVAQLPRETVTGTPDKCQKCHKDVDNWNDWPSFDDVSNEDLKLLNYCGVCGRAWDSDDREEHWFVCDGDRESLVRAATGQTCCTHCGVSLTPVTKVCSPPLGKWIIGGNLTSSAPGQTKGFRVNAGCLPNTAVNVQELMDLLGSWENERDNEARDQEREKWERIQRDYDRE